MESVVVSSLLTIIPSLQNLVQDSVWSCPAAKDKNLHVHDVGAGVARLEVAAHRLPEGVAVIVRQAVRGIRVRVSL